MFCHNILGLQLTPLRGRKHFLAHCQLPPEIEVATHIPYGDGNFILSSDNSPLITLQLIPPTGTETPHIMDFIFFVCQLQLTPPTGTENKKADAIFSVSLLLYAHPINAMGFLFISSYTVSVSLSTGIEVYVMI